MIINLDMYQTVAVAVLVLFLGPSYGGFQLDADAVQSGSVDLSTNHGLSCHPA